MGVSITGSLSTLDGILRGIERQGPLQSLLEGDVATCFWQVLPGEAHRRGIDAERAAEGYRKIAAFLRASAAGERPRDGYLLTFMRICARYPEVGQWENLWHEAHCRCTGWSTGKSSITQRARSGPRYLADDRYLQSLAACAARSGGFARVRGLAEAGAQKSPAGFRFAAYVERLCQTILRDATPEEWTPVLYRIIGVDEAPFKELAETGFSPAYVKAQTARYVDAVGPDVKIYPGIRCGGRGGRAGRHP